jgi:hypothetical protein
MPARCGCGAQTAIALIKTASNAFVRDGIRGMGGLLDTCKRTRRVDRVEVSRA